MKSFIIYEQLPSLNDYINKLKSENGRRIGAAFKRQIDNKCVSYIMAAGKGKIASACRSPIVIHFEWHEKSKRRDLDNVYSAKKYILDAMQKCNVLENDNLSHVKGLYDSVVYGNCDYVVVSIMSLEEADKLHIFLNQEISRLRGTTK